MRSQLIKTLCSTLFVLSLAGCGWFGGSDEDAELELPEWLSEESVEDSPQAETFASQPVMEKLELNLRPGDRFPLRKLVDQELTQASLSGEPETTRSQLELLLTITVTDVRDGRARMQVRYDDVRYMQFANGVQIEYDSSSPSAEIPPAVLGYHGMLGDGFAYWIGPDNQIDGVEGLREFVQRFLRYVPADRHTQLMDEFDSSSGRQAIADLVDITIGLLPFADDRSVGDRWESPQQVAGPVPLEIHTICTLEGLSDETADVALEGTIEPSRHRDLAAGGEDSIQVTVTRGRCLGSCTIDRRTGMPRESQLVQELDMKVQVAGGIEFDQHKRMVTTIEAHGAGTAHASVDAIGPRSR